MLQIAVLVTVAGAGIYYASLSPTMPPDGSKKDPGSLSQQHMFDYSETGINYQTFRPLALQSTSLNDAYAPYASPATDPTHSIPAVFSAIADNSAVVEAFAPNWFFHHWLEVPYNRAQQATANVEIPGPGGFAGGETLGNYPRSWIDGKNPPGTDKRFSSRLNMAAGQPTENEIKGVYSSNKISRDFNPYGTGGAYQRITGSRYANNTRKLGANLSSLPNVRGISDY